jgi:hypothetical protein
MQARKQRDRASRPLPSSTFFGRSAFSMLICNPESNPPKSALYPAFQSLRTDTPPIGWDR